MPDSGDARPSIWRSERGASPPKNVVIADDTTTADAAYRLACEGTALLWRGDFQNARQLLQALARRADKPARKPKSSAAHTLSPLDTFHLHRQAQAQRARVLSMVLIPFDADYGIPLRRAPDARLACGEAWGSADVVGGPSIASLRELLGLISAHEWRRKGVEIASLGKPPTNRIHPHYGVFSPVRGEYVGLVAVAPLPALAEAHASIRAFDIGTGTGVLSAVLARRGVGNVVATDQDPRALACAQENMARLGLAGQIQLIKTDLFPEGLANLIVCNPPWLPARASSPIEHAVYDEDSRMLLGFLNGLTAHLAEGGEGWLIMSDLAEHLGLRSPDMLAQAIDAAGLQVLGRMDARPVHPKASDATDPLHSARSLEVTSLWRLAPYKNTRGGLSL
ncbi:MAG TPA: class I SAM-dependent methyltransferase [Burkholderiaceae bacterium]|nr:class I SAM-dependent methyltransferase [Burkholderiaceae bacterium]